MRASIVRQIPLWDLIGRLWRRRWPRMWMRSWDSWWWHFPLWWWWWWWWWWTRIWTRSWDAWWWHCPVVHCEGCFPLSLWFPDYGHIVNTSMPLLLSKEGIVCKRMQTQIQVKYRCKYSHAYKVKYEYRQIIDTSISRGKRTCAKECLENTKTRTSTNTNTRTVTMQIQIQIVLWKTDCQ